MKPFYYTFFAFLIIACGGKKDNPKQIDFTTVFEKSKGTSTATYAEIIDFYTNLAEAYTSISTYPVGTTDAGEPLTLVTFNPNRTFESEFSDDTDLTRILINNGIHAGETDGIDATMMLMRDLANGTLKAPKNVWIGAIAVYNIGGALNRNSTSRTNQNGPVAYGFRGNQKNYDLNRDFMKQDSYNAKAFAKAFNLINPDVFIDTHVSNGADYQYTLTHLFTQHNKLGGKLGQWLNQNFQPAIEKDLLSKKWDITPYVNVHNKTPDQGFTQFMDSPRYSTGYTTLWNTLGLMVETHMLKPYKKRVNGTYELLKSVIFVTQNNKETIKTLRKEAFSAFAKAKTYPIQFKLDSSTVTTLNFKGYKGSIIKSEITQQDRLKYDQNSPFTKPVNFYNNFIPTKSITLPKAYVFSSRRKDIAQKLKQNGVQLKRLKKDTLIPVEVYHIADYKTYTKVYEGHYPHYATQVKTSKNTVPFKTNDYIVYTDQPAGRFLVEALEPEARDSWFNWNYFDTILQQKEGYSGYVWEDLALNLLKTNPTLKANFEAKKKHDLSFKTNPAAQLDWLHKNSKHYEKAHLRYPIARVSR